MRRFAIALAVALVVASTAGQARADDPPLTPAAKQHLDKGLELFSTKEYVKAIDEFRKGYDLQPNRIFLFSWAQAKRLSGDCNSAIKLYRKFLKTTPSEGQTTAAQAMIARCEEALGGPVPEEPEVVVTPEPQPDPEPAPEVEPEPVQYRTRKVGGSPFYKDVLGDVLVGVGVVGMGVGTAYFLMSSGTRDDANAAATYGEHESLIEDAQGQRTIGVIGLAAGGALLAVGVVRWVLRGNRDGREIQEPITSSTWSAGAIAKRGGAEVTVRFEF